jgi:hypothetical protein
LKFEVGSWKLEVGSWKLEVEVEVEVRGTINKKTKK